MPDTKCAAWYCIRCRNDPEVSDNLVKVHDFPEGHRLLQWELAVRSGHRNHFNAHASSWLCSDHFEPHCYDSQHRLRPEAVPTLFYIPTWEEENSDPDDIDILKRRRLRKILIEEHVERDWNGVQRRSASYFVLPLQFKPAHRGGAAKPGPAFSKNHRKMDLADGHHSAAMVDEEDFGEYTDEAIFGFNRKRYQCIRLLNTEPSGSSLDKMQVPVGTTLKECSVVIRPLEDIAKTQGVYATRDHVARPAIELEDPLYFASGSLDSIGASIRSKSVARRKNMSGKRSTAFLDDEDRGNRRLKAKYPVRTAVKSAVPKLVALDHRYSRDSRFEGCDPEQDPYRLRFKISELANKLKLQTRCLRRVEEKERRAQTKLKFAEEAISEYQKREGVSVLVPAKNLDNPIAREVVLCILRNGGTRHKQYSDLVKDFCKALIDINGKSYAVLRHVLGLPTERHLRLHKPKNDESLQEALSAVPGDDGRKTFNGAPGEVRRGIPLILTEDEFHAIGEDFEYNDYDLDTNRETLADLEEDGYETSLLANPPVVLGDPGSSRSPAKPGTSGTKRKKRRKNVPDDDDPDFELMESDDEDPRVTGKRGKWSKGKSSPKDKIQTPSFSVTVNQPAWQQPAQYYQQTDGSIHYVQTIPFDAAQQKSTYDLTNIIDFSQYH